MKTSNIIISLVFLVLSTLPLMSQTSNQATGKWLGTLVVNESVKLRLGIEVSENEQAEFVSVIHSLDQGAFDIPIKSTLVSADSIILNIDVMGAIYKGRYVDSLHIEGTFLQGNSGLITLKLEKVLEFPVQKVRRPQEPEKPYPYNEELVNIINENAEGVTLAGTLTTPEGEGPFPAVILISGSGPNDRDANIFGHKVFLVLADYLTLNGIAVLRTDDRGAHESTGDYNSADILALGSDVVALYQYLKTHPKIYADKIGVLGHSHGASVAPVAAVYESDISFAILMAGAAESLSENIIEQTEIIYKQEGVSDNGIALNTKFLNVAFDVVRQNNDIVNAKQQFEVFINTFENELDGVSEKDLEILELKPPLTADIIDGFMSPAMKKDLLFQPGDYLTRLACPTLVINGNKDVQVPIRHLYLTQKLIANNGNTQVTAKEFNNKNHLFQTCETGAISEYNNIEETISPEVLETIANWIINYENF
jgi:pimeloyl-ACP methyl ester carboxylesterase